MKQYILAGIIVLLSHSVFAEVTVKFEAGGSGTALVFYEAGSEIGRENYDADGVYAGTKGKIPDGAYKIYYKDGKTPRLEYTFKAGHKVAAKIFTEEGLLQYDAEYKNGLLDGKKTLYYKDKTPMQIISYRKGKKNGIYIAYHQTGKIEYEENYREEVKQGKRKTYYASGAPESEETYKDDVLDGPWKKYWENGKVKGETFYKNGAPMGSFKSYHENGKVETEANYRNGLLDGIMKVYGPDGKLKSEELYKDEKLIKKIK
ncbi:MAG: toxin-antitoxin system YwqK family antitoxin [Candidatus Firestonebacteria bacterium]